MTECFKHIFFPKIRQSPLADPIHFLIKKHLFIQMTNENPNGISEGKWISASNVSFTGVQNKI